MTARDDYDYWEPEAEFTPALNEIDRLRGTIAALTRDLADCQHALTEARQLPPPQGKPLVYYGPIPNPAELVFWRSCDLNIACRIVRADRIRTLAGSTTG